LKVLAVADSDSYLKWAACLLDGLPQAGTAELAVIRSPIAPSPDQIAAATAGTRLAARTAPELWAQPAAGAAPDGSPGRSPVAGSNGGSDAAAEDGAEGGPAHAGPPVLSARQLRRMAERLRPDVILVACTGPVVDVLVSEVLGGLRPRPVFVSGLPGISVPATEKAWLFRSGCDLFVVHSGREVAEFSAIAAQLGGGGEVGLARLPFLRPGTTGKTIPGTTSGTGAGFGTVAGFGTAAFGTGAALGTGAGLGTGAVTDVVSRDRVVFATQAKVPRRREERESILLALAELAVRRPALDVVVKLRALDGERQTHNERHHYERLWHEMVAGGRVPGGAVRFAAGPMDEHLARAAGFVTVSSTAALEAIAQSVPLIVLSDFGVGAEMINLVFEGSGCLGTLAELADGAFRTPDARWCAANYFHDPATDDWATRLVTLVDAARTGRLVPARSLLDGPEHAAARRRARLRVEVPPTVLRAGYRAKRRMRRYLKAIT
jgi:hypothetical protein